jgi:hypothetical protein
MLGLLDACYRATGWKFQGSRSIGRHSVCGIIDCDSKQILPIYKYKTDEEDVYAGRNNVVIRFPNVSVEKCLRSVNWLELWRRALCVNVTKFNEVRFGDICVCMYVCMLGLFLDCKSKTCSKTVLCKLKSRIFPNALIFQVMYGLSLL